ncbi:MAG: NUDIX hydrolase [Alphaproteobacteria bacterium]|nr:NUDIX hydrolase [Alphaproteobacteria bacterium]
MAERNRQVAALPWRNRGQGIEVLLISSRGTGRWVIPKGWPIPRLSPRESAAREAFEEAGIGGSITPKALGQYSYDKQLDNGSSRSCTVQVFGLEIMVQHQTWPEKGQRTARWFTREEAAAAVAEPELAAIIRNLR